MAYKIIRIVLFLALFYSLIFLYDYNIRFNSPKLYKAPSMFCQTRFIGITLPPVGIFICPDYFGDDNLRRHEMVHWVQYRRYGSIGFYIEYALAWIKGGFSYDNNWMEKEAVNLSNVNPINFK